MKCAEIDSFVNKFKRLWSGGFDASLNFESKLGEVFISLNCKVGRILPPPSTPLPNVTSKGRRSPSYYRRLARRKASRESNVEPTSYNVFEDSSSLLAEEAMDENSLDVPGPCSEIDEADTNVCQNTEESSGVVSSDEEEDELTVEGSTDEDSQETELEVLSDGAAETVTSEYLSDQLKTLIEESQRKRETWNRVKDFGENG